MRRSGGLEEESGWVVKSIDHQWRIAKTVEPSPTKGFAKMPGRAR
jgi:hypothetical protein